MPTARGLLLDIGGVVLRNAAELLAVLGVEDPRLQAVIDEIGIATDRDEQWKRMLDHEVSERDYWSQRAAELGAAVGEQWDTRAMINRMYLRQPSEYLVRSVVDLMTDVKSIGLPLGALTNDLEDFHGRAWMDQQLWLQHFDVIVDASVTGVMKPDPRAYASGAEALGLPPGEIVYLDDMPWNVEGGLKAGLIAIQVEHGNEQPAVDEARRLLGFGPSHDPFVERP